jgi:hypothetical protein
MEAVVYGPTTPKKPLPLQGGVTNPRSKLMRSLDQNERDALMPVAAPEGPSLMLV